MINGFKVENSMVAAADTADNLELDPEDARYHVG